jgi:hypothetical protein
MLASYMKLSNFTVTHLMLRDSFFGVHENKKSLALEFIPPNLVHHFQSMQAAHMHICSLGKPVNAQ